ncbi:MAG: prolyl oligopeptidase family serine peptidase [Holophagales bacterium]|nr:prolyl oligopeptidase family serine peptidase [Holophagales bacterium]
MLIAMVVLASATSVALAQATGTQIREPLPLEVTVSLHGHNTRSPINFSPDGAWIAHTVQTDETVPRGSGGRYAETGFPFGEGESRMEATVTRLADSESIRLGGEHSSSWAGIWSPDGKLVAFYSDEGGEAGLWIWDASARRAERLGSVLVRPFFGFETPRWSPDSGAILVKILPSGQSIASANELHRAPQAAPVRFPDTGPDAPSVWVRRVDASVDSSDPPDVESSSERRPPSGDVRAWETDLALVHLDGKVTRLVARRAIRDYAFSPDGRHVAFTVEKGFEPASQQPNLDVIVHEVATGRTRTLGTNVRLRYGIEWGWSPDSRHVAWFPAGSSARAAAAAGEPGRLMVVSISDGHLTEIGEAHAPSLDPGSGYLRPIWDSAGERVYGVGDGDLWEASLSTGALRRLTDIPGWRISVVVAGPHDETVWTTDEGRTLWVVARDESGGESGIFAVDRISGASRAALTERKWYLGILNVDGSSETGELAFVSTDQKHLWDIWTFDTRTGASSQRSRINPGLQRYELGSARLIEWQSRDGEPLAGSLLLPPGYREGERLPVVTWVYGGVRGSRYSRRGSASINRFGMVTGAAFNMHVLATRGYAVFFPDVPIRVGSPIADVMESVMTGVDAVIEQGYADPERLALMGQSYGAYNVLGIITRTHRFKAAVITAAVTHPDLFAAYVGGVHRPGYYEQGQGHMGGSIWEFPERYRENSPLFAFDRIDTPLLIGQGELDGDLVPSEAIFIALERLQKPVEYRVYRGEWHVITQRANVIDFWERRLEFLAEHLSLEIGERGAVVGMRPQPSR